MEYALNAGTHKLWRERDHILEIIGEYECSVGRNGAIILADFGVEFTITCHSPVIVRSTFNRQIHIYNAPAHIFHRLGIEIYLNYEDEEEITEVLGERTEAEEVLIEHFFLHSV